MYFFLKPPSPTPREPSPFSSQSTTFVAALLALSFMVATVWFLQHSTQAATPSQVVFARTMCGHDEHFAQAEVDLGTRWNVLLQRQTPRLFVTCDLGQSMKGVDVFPLDRADAIPVNTSAPRD